MRTAVARAAFSGLLLAGLLLVSACGHSARAGQVLRMCIDRWNQGNMVGQGPAPANVAFRRPFPKERRSMVLPRGRQCIVSIAAGDGTWTCVLTASGAYWCPPRHEPTGPPLAKKNAEIDGRGHLAFDGSLAGTHAIRRLRWQRYPLVDGTVKPWTPSGHLRPGVRFTSSGRGPCFRVGETVISGISCLDGHMRRYDSCFPQHKRWRAGEVAACGGFGSARFVRWTITERR
jgi:hypothetical protein